MEQYISKAAVVAEIEKLKEVYALCPTRNNYEDGLKEGRLIGYKDALNKINTLEVKEVDLKKEFYDFLDTLIGKDNGRLSEDELFRIAEYFFELGIKAKVDDALVEEIYSHIDGIKDTADRMTSGNFMHHRAAIKFSANVIRQVLGLIGFKAQKGNEL